MEAAAVPRLLHAGALNFNTFHDAGAVPTVSANA